MNLIDSFLNRIHTFFSSSSQRESEETNSGMEAIQAFVHEIFNAIANVFAISMPSTPTLSTARLIEVPRASATPIVTTAAQKALAPESQVPTGVAPVTIAAPEQQVPLPRRTWQIENLTVSACGPEGLDKQIASRLNDPFFQVKVHSFCQDGAFYAINKPLISPIRFAPDDSYLISRRQRAEFTVKAADIAPPAPSDRSFEYVSLGSGAMRQDLHHILFLLEKTKIPSIHISLIDTEYHLENRGIDFYGRRDFWLDCLADFAAIVKLQHPDIAIHIQTFSSVDEFTQTKKETIDLLTGVRIEMEKSESVQTAIHQLQQRMSEHHGILLSDTTAANRAVIKCDPYRVRQRKFELLFLRNLLDPRTWNSIPFQSNP